MCYYLSKKRTGIERYFPLTFRGIQHVNTLAGRIRWSPLLYCTVSTQVSSRGGFVISRIMSVLLTPLSILATAAVTLVTTNLQWNSSIKPADFRIRTPQFATLPVTFEWLCFFWIMGKCRNSDVSLHGWLLTPPDSQATLILF